MTQQKQAPVRVARRLAVAGCAAATLLAAAPAMADPAVHAAFGRDTRHDINKYEVALNWDTPLQYGNPDGWLAKLQAEVELARWNARSGNNRHDVTEFGLSPILRVEKRGGSVVPFLEASVGLRLMSSTYTSDSHHYSTAFQFSDMIGFGVAFGPQARAEAGFRFQHISNASIKAPNPGTNFYTGYLRYRF
ncbi:lipid A 3-O-deacylase PagL [Cupriavidus gilardii J11]|uniref:Lipid A deacylase n=1 Tax=Cupriavidus gilardii J11 TaxID=936133 RepID=A0A562BQG6_9BURK|nr:acyloxyacyl hydrolase [Cupriavidus gilardii]TWG87528.1 lipid A 3-O-deacylase PagL [Cupriavidus gilardii J11]